MRLAGRLLTYDSFEYLFSFLSLQCFIRHSSELLCWRVFQYLKEPISSLRFSLLHRRNSFCSFRCGEYRRSWTGELSLRCWWDHRMFRWHCVFLSQCRRAFPLCGSLFADFDETHDCGSSNIQGFRFQSALDFGGSQEIVIPPIQIWSVNGIRQLLNAPGCILAAFVWFIWVSPYSFLIRA